MTTETIYSAMAKAFAEIGGAVKDRANPHFKSKYADLSSVMDAVKPALANHGMFFRQITHPSDGGVCVETMICHASGQELSGGMFFVPANKNDAQGYGSALTYAKRYSLQTTFGVPSEDDDGNAASRPVNVAPVDAAKISAAQLAHLQAALEANGRDVAKFCAFAKIDALPDLPAARFDGAMKAIAEAAANAQRKAA